MQFNTSRNKLIVLLIFSGSYKGGAQRRYLALFNYLQQINKNDYFLLLNETLYSACFRDHILTDNKNVICVPVKYGEKLHPKTRNTLLKTNATTSAVPTQRSKLYNFLGSLSSFIKQFRGWISYSLQLIKIVKKYNISIIYGVFSGGMWSWQVARLLHIKFIYSYMDASASMIESNISKFLSSEFYPLKFAHKIDFLSEGVRNKLYEKGIIVNDDRALISTNSFILYDNFYPKYPKKNRIMYSARLTHFKNPYLLLESISLLKKKDFSDFEMFFLGEGVLLKELINKKEELKLDNVFFEGGVVDTAKYLRESKIFISIQCDNNYPSQSLLEAMACENAIIASDVGETRLLVTEKEGILVNLNAEEIAEAIQNLFTTPGLIERLGKNARKKVLKEHTIEKFAEYFYSITD